MPSHRFFSVIFGCFYFSISGINRISNIVKALYFLNKISSHIAAPVFPSWVLSRGFYPKRLSFLFDVIDVVNSSQLVIFRCILVKKYMCGYFSNQIKYIVLALVVL